IVLPRVAHRQSRYLNNRAENSHQPTRQRERRMKRFKSPGHAQRFLEAHDILSAHFPPQTTFTFCRELSSRKAASIRDMAGDHRSLISAWNTTPARRAAALSKPFKPIQRLSHRNVTVPSTVIPWEKSTITRRRGNE